MPTASSQVKVWRATPSSQSGVVLSDGSAKLVGNRGNFVVADKDGVAISGPVSFITTSDQKRSGGLFVELNDFVKMIPTTIVTPMPNQIPWPPFSMISSIARDVPIFLGLLVGVGVGKGLSKYL